MGRLNLNIPDDLHEAFRVAIAKRDDVSQTKFILRCMRAYAAGTLWFEMGHPRTRMDSDTRCAPDPVAVAQVPPKDSPVPSGVRMLGVITEQEARALNKTHPHMYAEGDDGELFDVKTGVSVGRVKR